MAFDYGNRLHDGQHEHHPTKLEGELVAPIRFLYEHDTCGQYTRCPVDVAETWARHPRFYNTTYCFKCQGYFPVEQFKWTGSNVRLGEIG